MDSVVVRTAGVMAAPVDEDVVILNLARDDYVALDEIGRRVWDLLEQPRRVAELCAELRREFDAPAHQLEADVLGFLVQLEGEDLVRATNPRG